MGERHYGSTDVASRFGRRGAPIAAERSTGAPRALAISLGLSGAFWLPRSLRTLRPTELADSALRRLGKAPMVKLLNRGTLEAEVKRAGFVDLSWPDVGAKPNIAFLVAAKPR